MTNMDRKQLAGKPHAEAHRERADLHLQAAACPSLPRVFARRY
jgi:hypothetical protein